MSLSELPSSLLGAVFGCLAGMEMRAARRACKNWRNARPFWRRVNVTDKVAANISHICVPSYLRRVSGYPTLGSR